MNNKITKISSINFSFLLFFLSISFKIINTENSTTYLDFPLGIMLSNDNIFVIHQNGVSVYDSTFSKLISDEVIFSDSEKIIYEYYLSKITIEQFENGYIITIINDYIYIFDYKGTFIFKSTRLLDDYAFGYYYSIVPIKFFDGYYYYIITYIDSQIIFFIYYKFHLENKINSLINRYQMKHEIGTTSYLLYESGLSCQKMSYSFSEVVLSCFFVSNYATSMIVANEYSITETEIQNKGESININMGMSGIKVIKSAVNYSGTKSVVCVMLADGTCYCFQYKSSDMGQGTNISLKTMYKSTKCNSNYYSLKVGYIKGLENYVISCIGVDQSIQAKIYSDSFEKLMNMTKFSNCTSIYGHSILYSFKSNEYYDLSDIICNGKRYPFNILTKKVEEEIPTTIISTTLIKTTIPTTLIKATIPTTLIKTTIPTTLIKTTIPTTLIQTTIPTTLIKTTIPTTLIQTTIPTTIIDRLTETDEENEIEESDCIELEKCSKCNTESILMNLCIKCNKQKGYYLLIESFHENNISLTLIKTISEVFKNDYKKYKTDNLSENIINCYYDIIKKEDLIIKEDNNILFTITTTDNQKMNEKINVTTINLGDCEKKLKEKYNIPNDKSLYIFKIDIKEEGMKIPIIQYEIYFPLHGEKLEKLNLSICENMKVEISIPVSINEEDIDKYNSSSGFYNDICYTYTSEKGTDVCLNDRKTEFVESNMSLCEEDCDFKGYNSTLKRALCSCPVKIKLLIIPEIRFNKTKLYDNFININYITNIKVIKCYHVLFSKEGISNNIGIYIIVPIIIFHFICLIIFYIKEYKKLKHVINQILYFKSQNKKLKINNKNENNNISNNSKINSIQVVSEESNKSTPPIKNIKINKRKYSTNILKANDILLNSSNKKVEITNNFIDKKNIKNKEISLINNNSNIKLNENIIRYNNYELNMLSYEKAKKFDKRSYLEYYFSLLKTKHLLIFSFYPSDYNSRIIKIDLLFISFVIYYTVNALFYNDSTMHKIYEDGGSYNFIYQIPQILYSALISSIFNIILKTLSLSERSILKIKHEDNKQNLKNKSQKISKSLDYKFILYFIISFIFLLFFLYYLSCFCAVFKNTQLHLIKDTIISFIVSLIYPIFIYLLPGIIRIPALRTNKKNGIILYNISKFIELIL